MRKDKKQNVKKAAAQNKFRAKNPMQTLKRILGYWKPYRGQLIGALICMIANVLCNIAGTFMLGSVVVNNYILPLAYANGVYVTSNAEIIARAAEVTMQNFGGIVGVMAAMYVVGAGLDYLYSYILVRVTTKTLQSVRDEMFERWKNCPSNISTLTPTAT